jgi:hypothetical protein
MHVGGYPRYRKRCEHEAAAVYPSFRVDSA